MTAAAVPVAEDATVFVVDDDPAVRKSLRWLMESVGLNVLTFESAAEFLEGYRADRPGCVVLDVRMPGMGGLELQERLRERGCRLPVIVVTAYGDVPMAVRSIQAGAVHFFEKPVSDQVLLEHVQQSLAADVRRRQEESHLEHTRTLFARLTQREQEVLDRVVDGMSSREIGELLGVSYKTVEAHRAKIMRKTESDSVAHLIRRYLSLSTGRTNHIAAAPKG
jgi:two-component system response regulator FixJ